MSTRDLIERVAQGESPRAVLRGALDEAPEGRKVTIYLSGAAGNVLKTEGFFQFWEGVGAGGTDLHYIPKGARKTKIIMGFYTHFMMVVDGWGHPDPGHPGDPSTFHQGQGVSSYQFKYRSFDPRWISDFMGSVGKHLHTLAWTEDGGKTLHNPGGLKVLTHQEYMALVNAKRAEKGLNPMGGY